MLRRIYWDTALSASDPVLRVLRDVAGINQVLYGTDFPYLRGDLAVNSDQRILQSSELSDPERRAILAGNTSRLFPSRFRPPRNMIWEERTMQSSFLKITGAETPRLGIHPLSQQDPAAHAHIARASR